MVRSGVLLFAAASFALAAGAALDLDVALDPGRPYDFIKTPSDTPTGGGRSDTESALARRPEKLPAGKPGETVTDDETEKRKQPPPAPPSGLPGVSAPSTIDWAQHLPWKPKDEIVEWKDPMTPSRPQMPTGPAAPAAPPPGKDVWDASAYPPRVSNELYVYCVTRFLQVLLHRPQVSESELTQLLIDMDYPAYYAATAVKGDGSLRGMAEPILQAVGPLVKTPPNKPDTELKQRVYMDLMAKYPYEPGFGSFILSQPTGETLPVLLQILERERHPFVVRNAVFILRCFNNRQVVEPLFKQLTLTRDGVIRVRALIALARWGHLGTAKWCAARLRGPDSFRTLAVWAIGRIALVSPLDADTVEKVFAAAREFDASGEFLLSAVPALGQIGRYADAATKKKIENLFAAIRAALPSIKNPPSQGGTGPGMVPNPDPPGVRGKIVEERIRISLALMGHPAEIKWAQEARSSGIHISNTVFLEESLRLIGQK